jgi:hypothetical protein
MGLTRRGKLATIGAVLRLDQEDDLLIPIAG